MAGSDKKLLGSWGERLAAEYMRKKGYKLIGLNYRCRFGEIDVISEDRKYVVFVEVKLRKSAAFAEAREFVTASKQEKLIAAAQMWMQQNPTNKQPRFDVVEIYAPQGIATEKPEINHIENAFSQE